jgi:hypothetical protein
MREIREELNVDIEVERFFETGPVRILRKNRPAQFLLLPLPSRRGPAFGLPAMQVGSSQELGGYSFPPANEPILQKLLHA